MALYSQVQVDAVVFPSHLGLGNGNIITEENLRTLAQYSFRNRVIEGFDYEVYTSSSEINLTINPGKCYYNGYYVDVVQSVSFVLPKTNNYYFYIRLDKNSENKVSSVYLECYQDDFFDTPEHVLIGYYDLNADRYYRPVASSTLKLKQVALYGYFKDGEQVNLPDIGGEDIFYYPYDVVLLPFLPDYPLDIPVVEAPSSLTITPSGQGSYTYYVAVQSKRGDKKGAWITGKSSTGGSGASISWSTVEGATSYLVYVSTSGFDALEYVGETANNYYDVSGSYSGNETLSYDIMPQQLVCQAETKPNYFIPDAKVYSFFMASSDVNVSVPKDQTYSITTPSQTTTIGFKAYLQFTINWPGFSGECTWWVRFKVRYKKSSAQEYVELGEYKVQEYWGSQYIGGSKSYSVEFIDFEDLQDVDYYTIEFYDIQTYASNNNFYFTNVRVLVSSIYYGERKPIKNLSGVYMVLI